MGASSLHLRLTRAGPQTLADWIDAHARAFEAIGGAARLIVPDNPKVAVIKACSTSLRSTAPTPRWRRITTPPCCRRGRAGRATRPRSSRRADRRALASRPLRNRRFHSLAEVNAAIRELLVQLNDERPIRRLGAPAASCSRRSTPRLKPLPAEPYVFAEWRVRKVGLDYHVDVDGTSTPCPTASPAPASRCG
jgi:hypothetical protein